ncbi:hypothetical protein [Sinomonas sp. G460-2]|uniref:hypothetical protein n=1 Tax=Sinomonas sp. G460-2 TaxID=3393464 RepID=UPI0039EF2C55
MRPSRSAIAALAGQGTRVLSYPWALLILGATVSTAANAVHAILSVQNGRGVVPPLVSALVASMPPVVLLLITHLSVVLVQRTAPAKPAKPIKATKPKPAAKERTASAPVEVETVPDTVDELIGQF